MAAEPAYPDLPVIDPALALLVALASVAFLVAGGAFLAHDIIARRDALAKRLTLIRPPPAELHRAPPGAAPERESRWAWLARGGIAPREAQMLLRIMEKCHVPAERASLLFFVGRVTLAALLGVGAALLVRDPTAVGLGQRPLVAGLVLALAGWYLPRLVLRWLAARRLQAIEAGLPEALELLVVAVEAGLALEDGIERIVVELKRSQPELAEELVVTCADLKILPSRDLALQNLAKRVDTPSVRSVVTTLSQTMRYGTPLAQALHVVSSELRNEALFKLEERANRLPVLLTVPMMVLILPTIFLIVGGPAVIQLIDVLVR